MTFVIDTPRTLCAIAVALAGPLALAQSTGAPTGAGATRPASVPSTTGTGSAVGTGTGAAGAMNTAKLSRSDRNFFNTAAEDGMAEVELGKLAQQKGTDAVKAFGAQMVTDHGKAGDELKALAASKGVTLPASPGKHQKDIDKLSKKSGAEFDRDYTKEMVSAHQKAVSLFEKTAKSADDADVKDFAGKTLPTLKQHLDHVQSLEASVKASK